MKWRSTVGQKSADKSPPIEPLYWLVYMYTYVYVYLVMFTLMNTASVAQIDYRLSPWLNETQSLQYLRGDADKFLAPPGRKQDTTTKLGIYSTYSSRSSIHFLARSSNFCKPLKNYSECCPGPENREGDQDIGSPGRAVSFGLPMPGEPGHCRARTRHPSWFSRCVFPSNCPSIAPAEMSNTPRW